MEGREEIRIAFLFCRYCPFTAYHSACAGRFFSGDYAWNC